MKTMSFPFYKHNRFIVTLIIKKRSWEDFSQDEYTKNDYKLLNRKEQQRNMSLSKLNIKSYKSLNMIYPDIRFSCEKSGKPAINLLHQRLNQTTYINLEYYLPSFGTYKCS